MKNHQIRIGLLGAGRIGKIHATSLVTQTPAAKLVAVADIHAPAAETLGKAFGLIASDDPQTIIADPSIDAVLICSSTDTHATLTIAAAQAGKHVFCEKPLDFSLERIDTVLAAVQQAGVKLMVGFHRRFDANFSKVKQMLEDGHIGEPHILRITSRDPSPPPLSYIQVSGGIFLDMTIHDFDMAQFLFGEVAEVYVAGGVLVDPALQEAGDIDTALTSLKFSCGAFGVIDNSRQAVYGYDQRIEAFGSAGMVDIENNRPNSHTYSSAAGILREKPHYFFLERYKAAYISEINAFVDCIINDTVSPVTGIDARASVAIALAARRSHLENRPVKINEIQ